MNGTLEREILDAAIAIGLLDPSGVPQFSWFGEVDKKLKSILSDAGQRGAVLDLLDQIAPPASIPGIASGEKWHPILSGNPRGNLYVTVDDTVVGGHQELLLGLGGELNGGSSAASPFLRAKLPLFGFNSSPEPDPVAGTKDGPLTLTLRVPLNWTHSQTSIGLQAIQADIRLAPFDGEEKFSVLLEGLDLDGSGGRDVTLDPSNLSAEATHVVIGLIHQTLLGKQGGPPGEATMTVLHLMPLLGLGDDGIPVFPFTELLNGPSALQSWLNSIISGGKMPTWLGHLTSLFSGGQVIGKGTAAEPWMVQLATITNVSSQLNLTFAVSDGVLLVGVQAALTGSTTIGLDIGTQVVGIPLAGTSHASVLPSASLALRAPVSGGPLVSNATISADSLRAGLEWNGTALRPLVEILNVTLNAPPQPVHYDRVDLTNADSVAAAAENIVLTEISNALGSGTATTQHLLALVGLARPAGDAAWPAVDFAKLVSSPTQAIAQVHRAGLAGSPPTHNWGVMFAEIAALIGFPGAVQGSGTRDQPWSVALAPPVGPLAVNFVAWNDAAPGADPQLRLGLELAAASAPWQISWLAELLAFDLPASGHGRVAVLGAQHGSFTLAPIPATPSFAGMTLAADSAGLNLNWSPGNPLSLHAVIKNLSITDIKGHTVIGTLSYTPTDPLPADFQTLAGNLGIGVPQLEDLVRILFARAAYSWTGMPGLAATVLLGIHGNLPGMQSDWPTLQDPGAPGSLFTDPLGALRNWLAQVTTGLSSTDQTPFLLPTLDWLRAFTGDSLPSPALDSAPMAGIPLVGNGVYEDPWSAPIARTGSVHLARAFRSAAKLDRWNFEQHLASAIHARPFQGCGSPCSVFTANTGHVCGD